MRHERLEPSTPIKGQILSRSISPRRGKWKREASKSSCHHSRRKSNEGAGR